MDVMKKMTFCVFIGHERKKLFGGIFIFIKRVSPSEFSRCDFLANFLTKGLFLTSTTQPLATVNGGNCSWTAMLRVH